MKVIRSTAKLWIETDDGDEVEILFPNVARFHNGFSRFEVVADDLEHILEKLDHYLAALASAAISAELYAKMTNKPRWLVYYAGTSYDTPYEEMGAPRVEYKDGKVVWTNPEEANNEPNDLQAQWL